VADSGYIFDQLAADRINGLILQDGCTCQSVPTNDGRFCMSESVCDTNEAEFILAGFIKALYDYEPDLKPFMTSGE
jgi:hypothetical protein